MVFLLILKHSTLPVCRFYNVYRKLLGFHLKYSSNMYKIQILTSSNIRHFALKWIHSLYRLQSQGQSKNF
jgi:hypothetical protein